MHHKNIERVHIVANRMAYDLGIPDSARHPVRFFSVCDILHAAGEIQSEVCEDTLPAIQIQVPAKHAPACDCRFCATDLLDTRVLRRALP